jgi:hypothetical protein
MALDPSPVSMGLRMMPESGNVQVQVSFRCHCPQVGTARRQRPGDGPGKHDPDHGVQEIDP